MGSGVVFLPTAYCLLPTHQWVAQMHDDIAQRDQLAPTLAVRHDRPAYLRRQDLAGWLFISPVLLFLLVFFLGPLIFAVVLSLHDWDMLSPVTHMTWVGLRYYVGLLQDPLFLLTLRNTCLYTIGSLVFIPPLALGVETAGQKMRTAQNKRTGNQMSRRRSSSPPTPAARWDNRPAT